MHTNSYAGNVSHMIVVCSSDKLHPRLQMCHLKCCKFHILVATHSILSPLIKYNMFSNFNQYTLIIFG